MGSNHKRNQFDRFLYGVQEVNESAQRNMLKNPMYRAYMEASRNAMQNYDGTQNYAGHYAGTGTICNCTCQLCGCRSRPAMSGIGL